LAVDSIEVLNSRITTNKAKLAKLEESGKDEQEVKRLEIAIQQVLVNLFYLYQIFTLPYLFNIIISG
jgi:hypothetical protein